jgi:hypothetical protein
MRLLSPLCSMKRPELDPGVTPAMTLPLVPLSEFNRAHYLTEDVPLDRFRGT